MRQLLSVFLAASCWAETRIPFTVSEESEVVTELEMSAPEASAVATIRIDGKPDHHVRLFAGPQKHRYRIFLGSFAVGRHELIADREAQATFKQITQRDSNYDVIANAPVLYERANTAGKFSDIPLLVYAERSPAGLTYTVVFSNEDGGTSTRALMARWGRTTDIEYVYTVKDGKAIVQGPGHKDIEFTGKREGMHPLLMPVTNNNMIGAATTSGLRFQIAPMLIDLSKSSREQVMDDNPWTYQVMAHELIREGKLRPYGTVDGEKISDLRNYLFVEYKAKYRSAAFTVAVHDKEGRSYSSDLGRLDYSIGRDGWVRTTVELPPGASTKAIEFRCVVAPSGHSGECNLEAVSKAFFLDPNYLPAKPIWSMTTPRTIPTGQAIFFTLQ